MVKTSRQMSHVSWSHASTVLMLSTTKLARKGSSCELIVDCDRVVVLVMKNNVC